MVDNDRAEEMAQRFHAGEGEFQTDAKWWELAEEADRSLLVGDSPPTATPTEDDEGRANPQPPVDFWGDRDGRSTLDERTVTESQPAPPARESIPSLTQEYRDDGTEMRWDIKALSVQRHDPDLLPNAPWRLLRTTAGTYEFLVYVNDAAFGSATLTPLDALLAELAWSAMDFLRGQRTSASFASVFTRLRARYATASRLDPVVLAGEAGATLRSIARSLSRNIQPGDAQVLFDELSPSEKASTLRRLAAVAGADVGRLISEGRFLEYAPRETLLRFFERHPDLFLDGRYWDISFTEMDLGDAQVTEEARALVVRRLSSLLADAVWLADQDPDDLADAGRTRLLRAALSLELLGADTSEDSQ